MSTGRKFLIAGFIALFILAKIYFALTPKVALVFLAVPAFLLILSEPAEAH